MFDQVLNSLQYHFHIPEAGKNINRVKYEEWLMPGISTELIR